MRVPKRPFVFRFKNEKRKASLMYLNHSLSRLKMEIKSRIEVTVNNVLDHKLIQECSRMLHIYIHTYIYIYIYIYIINTINIINIHAIPIMY